MRITIRATTTTALLVLLLLVGCGPSGSESGANRKVFTGATVYDGLRTLSNAAIVVEDGRVRAIGPAGEVAVPANAERIDLAGKYVTPGWIVGHGHLGGAKGLQTGPEIYTRETLLDQLGLYARYGGTTIVSLGGDGSEAVELRDAQNTPDLNRARLFLAGKIVEGKTPQQAQAVVAENAAMRVDFIKIRVDDNLGASPKMPREVSKAIIDEANRRGLRVAVHIFYLNDAKQLLKDGADFIAHSVRDKPVDDEFIALMKDRDLCLCPTLTREVSTFVYETVPEFFSDPFFLKEADPAVLEELKRPERQQRLRESKSAQQYKQALKVAMANLKRLQDSGVRIVMGTDTGPPARFQGYFEHMEMDLMAQAGLTPEQILRSATSDAANCLDLKEVGILEPGRWADLVVFAANPMADIKNTRSLESVWIAGNRVPEK